MNDENYFKIILNVLSRNLGINMQYYDKKYLKRRITSRMNYLGIDSFEEYYKYLVRNSSEVYELINFIAINYTEFFRDKEVFDYIYKNIFPMIFKNKEVKILSAGCSTGQEVYSIAMLIYEYLDKDINKYTILIVGGDIDREALNYASHGIYREDEMKNIDDRFIKKYFIKINSKYKIRDEVKRIVSFKYMDLTSEIKDSEIYDMVLCRNVIIYIDQKYKKIIFENLYKMLKDGGYLIIGKSESLPINLKDKFEVISLENKIYRKR